MKYEDLLGKTFEYGSTGPDTFDCWTLCQELAGRVGKMLPDFPRPEYQTQKIAELVTKVQSDFVLLEKPDQNGNYNSKKLEPFCLVLLMLHPPIASHIGFMTEDCKSFIHILPKTRVTREKLSSPVWSHRIKGFYKWKEIASS